MVGQPIVLLTSLQLGSLGEFANAPINSVVQAYYLGESYDFTLSYSPTHPNGPSIVLNRISSAQMLTTRYPDLQTGASGIGFALEPGGSIIFSGNFTQVQSVPHQRLIRILADGSVDHSFNPSVNDAPECVAIQNDGKILLAGPFATVNGMPRKGLARLHPDGTLDDTFDPQLSSTAYRAVPLENGKIYISGPFRTIGEHTRPGVARLLEDGSVDPTFTTNLPSNTHLAYALQPLPDGSVLVGGSFPMDDGPNQYLLRFLEVAPAISPLLLSSTRRYRRSHS